MDVYSPAASHALPPAPGPVRARLKHPEPATYRTSPEEVLEFYAGPEVYGLLILPQAAAYDVISRLEQAPGGMPVGQRRAAGHVRYALDDAYKHDDDAPDDWTTDLIFLIRTASEQERRRLGSLYPAYVVAVAIASAPDGLQALEHFHLNLPPDGQPGPASGG